MTEEQQKNLLDDYAPSRIIRRCGQLKIPFKQIANSRYFQSRKDKIPKSNIQYMDGVKNAVGWGDSTKPIPQKDTVPFSHEEMIILLRLDEENDYVMSMPDEIADDVTFPEGTTKTVSVERYERNPIARKACIAHYGPTCSVCGFHFENVYGEIGRNFIHVHHLTRLSDIGKKYEVDAISDLRPVCPNCHAMLHKGPPFEIEQLKEIMKHHQYQNRS